MTTTRDHIRNPVEWTADQLAAANVAVARTGHAVRGDGAAARDQAPAVRHIEVADLKDALARGMADFTAARTDIAFICLIYPIAGLVLWRLAVGYGLLPLLFPLAAGFVLLGPVAAVGLYEMSRRREQGLPVSWANAFGVLKSPAFGAILVLGLVLVGIFLLWLGAAQAIYAGTLGPEPPASLGSFTHDVLTTANGWAMIVVGIFVGFLFAVVVLSISVVSVPAAARPRRGAGDGGRDLDPGGDGEPAHDGDLGPDRGGRPAARLDPGAARPDRRHAGAGPRHLAPLPQGGDALTRGRPGPRSTRPRSLCPCPSKLSRRRSTS